MSVVGRDFSVAPGPEDLMGVHRWEDIKRRRGGGETERHEGVLIGYNELEAGTWEARLFWSRGDPLAATAPTLAEARSRIRAVLVDAVGEAEAASLLEYGAESLPLGADE